MNDVIGVTAMGRKQIFLLALMCVVWASAASPDRLLSDEPAKLSATVVCFGDSITKRGYPSMLGEQLGVESINAGIAGNTSREGLRRVERDVLHKQPDVVVVFFGTNDIRADAPKKFVELGEYKSNLMKIINACRAKNAEVVLCTLPPIDSKAYFTRHDQEVFDEAGGLELLISRYRNAAVEVAGQADTPLVDLNQLLKDDPNWLSNDGMHPSAIGSKIIAKHIGDAVARLLGRRANRQSE
jgi:lysophospholipase L1-like esterase